MPNPRCRRSIPTMVAMLALWSASAGAVQYKKAAATTVTGPLVGDPAPALTIERWLKGDAVARFAKGKVYVLDIWAPWCGPCLASMPELSEMQEKNANRGLVVIGLSGVDEYGSTLEKAQKALDDRASQVRYRIAWDKGRETYERWMAVESGAGWPWCFVVDREGRIAWTGHPSHLNEVLEPVLAGTWNLDSARTSYAHRAKGLTLGSSFMTAYRADRFSEARALYGELQAHDVATAGDYAAAMFKMLRVKMKRTAEADSFARAVAPTMTSQHVGTLVRMADLILDPAAMTTSDDLALALDLATRARSMAQPSDWGTIATLAEAQYRKGDSALAVETQREAIAAAPAENREQLEKAMERYQAKGR